MRNILFLFILFFSVKNGTAQNQDSFVLVIHGGAGTIPKSSMTPEKEAAYKAGLTTALEKGLTISPLKYTVL